MNVPIPSLSNMFAPPSPLPPPPRTNVDLIFTKVKSKASNKLTYDQFLGAVNLFAEKKRVNPTQVKIQIAGLAGLGGPSFSGTVALCIRLHDAPHKSRENGKVENGRRATFGHSIYRRNLLRGSKGLPQF